MEKYKVTLTADERFKLEQLVRKGKAAARKLAHARILLLADEGDDRTGRADEQIAETLQVSLRTGNRSRPGGVCRAKLIWTRIGFSATT